jgi:23S rRNA (guanosine2251-2'-O)-methyltransferase
MAAAGYGDSVEGIHAVRAALGHGRVTALNVERGRVSRGEVADLVAAAEASAIEVRTIEDVRRMAATSAPQGVVARCRPIAPVGLPELVAETTPASLLVVDHAEDAHNLGAIARSAVAAGVPRLVVPDRRSAPLGPAAFKAAAGAFERCRIAIVSSIAAAVDALRDAGVWTVGLDAGGETSLFGLELLASPVAVVVGAETGLHRLVRERVDVVAAIPMVRETESLNASVAAAIACFEIARVRA